VVGGWIKRKVIGLKVSLRHLAYCKDLVVHGGILEVSWMVVFLGEPNYKVKESHISS
jgi:hypothetical protein